MGNVDKQRYFLVTFTPSLVLSIASRMAGNALSGMSAEATSGSGYAPSSTCWRMALESSEWWLGALEAMEADMKQTTKQTETIDWHLLDVVVWRMVGTWQ